MQRETLAECQPGDWVAMMDAEEWDVDVATQAGAAPDGGIWTFRFREMEIEGGTAFVGVLD